MTLREVAQQAGVSIATASRVMNTPDMVREPTRSRVLEAAKALKYRPNRHAQSLVGGVSRVIGVIVSNVANPFFADILQALERRATEHDYELVLESTDYRPARLEAALNRMLGRRLAGIAVAASEADAGVIERLAAAERPAAILDDSGASDDSVTRIAMRYDDAMRRAVEYLHSLGHRRMGFVSHHGSLDPLRERESGFETTVRSFPGVEYSVAAGSDSPSGGRQALRSMLDSGFKPTAVLAVNDFMAVGALRELRKAGLEVPRDVSLIGFDNIELSEYLTPALTTVNVPRRRIGEIMFDALINDPKTNEGIGRRIQLEPELVLRDSTAVVAQSGKARARSR